MAHDPTNPIQPLITPSPSAEPALPAALIAALTHSGVHAHDEVSLRRALEDQTPGYNLFRLTPAAARRWKCRYRILLEAGYYDGQSAAEAYARALLATLPPPSPSSPTV